MTKVLKELILKESPDRNQFKIRLKKLDPEFIVSESSPSVVLFYLPHGVYVGLYPNDNRILITVEKFSTKYQRGSFLWSEVYKIRKKYAKKIVIPYIKCILDNLEIEYKEKEVC